MNNLKRLKKLVLANKETRRLYRMMQFLAIFMVISCTIIVVVAKWIEQDQNQKREELFGSWDEVFLDVPAEDLNYFKQNAFLEQISIQSIQEKVFLEGDKRVVIGSCDDNFLEMGNIEVLEGRMPEKENEVAVEEEYLEILGVSEIGDIITNSSQVDSLIGHKVVGIIENYSNRWKLINNIKFLNCVIAQKDSNIFNVFVNYRLGSKRDPEINMINYKINIERFHINIEYIIKTILLFLFAIIMILLLIIQRIKIILGKKPRKFLAGKNRDKIEYCTVLLLFIMDFVMLIIIGEITNTININYDVSLIQNNHDAIVRVDNETLSMLNFYWYDIQNGALNETKFNLYFAVNQIIDKFISLFKMTLILFLMMYVLINIVLNYGQINKNKLFNYNYFYSKSNFVSKHLLFIRMVSEIIIGFVLCVAFIDKYKFAEINDRIKFINIYFLLALIIFSLMHVVISIYVKSNLNICEEQYK